MELHIPTTSILPLPFYQMFLARAQPSLPLDLVLCNQLLSVGRVFNPDGLSGRVACPPGVSSHLSERGDVITHWPPLPPRT